MTHSQASYPARRYVCLGDACNGTVVHARMEVPSLDPERQSGQHVLTSLHRGVADAHENSESTKELCIHSFG